MKLIEKIESREAIVAIIGLGYVGLPLAVSFAEAGFRVIGIDIDEERVESINSGKSYVTDVQSEKIAALIAEDTSVYKKVPAGSGPGYLRYPSSDRLLTFQPARQLSATTDFDALNIVDAAIICVPTPLDKTKSPDISCIIAATDEIGMRLHRNMLIILESTTYPGTTNEIVLPLLENHARLTINARPSGREAGVNGNGRRSAAGFRSFKVGTDFFLAFSPERVDPGRTDYTIRTTPKVLGGVTQICAETAEALYACIIDHVVLVSSPRVAEMAKLLENTFRAVNIALVNEVAIMCDRLGLDVWEVIDAAKTKPYGFMTFYPGPGLGGHCIPIDPEFLAWKLKLLNYNARFIQLATDINCNMPNYVLTKIVNALNEDGKPLNGTRVLLLGITYKADINDVRESPSLDLIQLLLGKRAVVTYHDPFIHQLHVDGLEMQSVVLSEKSLQTVDCVVITAAHSTYDWSWVVKNSRLIVDTRNATDGVSTNTSRIVKL